MGAQLVTGKPATALETLLYTTNPNLITLETLMNIEKPYLHAKPAPTPQALSLTYIKILEHKQKPNLHEKPYLLPIL